MQKKFTLPSIEQKSIGGRKDDFDNYNFVKDGGRRSKGSFTNVPVEDEEDLRAQITRLKKELDLRNASVMALQRNFESLSTMLKTEKSEGSRFRTEAQQLREQYLQSAQRVKDLESKLEEMGARVSKGKQESDAALEKVANANKTQQDLSKATKRISELESMVESRNSSNLDLQADIKELNARIAKILAEEKSDKIEAKRLSEALDSANKSLQEKEEEKKRAENQIAIMEQNFEALMNKMNDMQGNREDSELLKEEFISTERKLKKEITTLKNTESDLLIQLKKLSNQFEATQTLLKIKQNAESAAKSELAVLKESSDEIQVKNYCRTKGQNTQIKELKVLREERGSCKCTQYLSLIQSYEELKKKCKDEVILLSKFEVESSRQLAKELRESVSLLNKELAALRISVSTAESDERILTESNRALADEISSLKEAVTREQNITALIQKEKSELQNALKRSNEQATNLSAAQEERDAFFSMVSAKDSLIEKLQAELKKSEFDCGKLMAQIAVEKDQVNVLSTMLRDTQANLANISEDLKVTKESNKSLKSVCSDLEKKLAFTTSSKDENLSLVQKEIDEMRDRMRAEIENAHVLNQTHQELISVMQAKEAESKNMKAQLNEQIALLQSQNSQLISELKLAQASKEETVHLLTQANFQKEAFVSSSIQLQKELEKVKAEKEETNRQLSTKEGIVYRQDLEIKTLFNKLTAAEKTLEDLDPAKAKKFIEETKEKERLVKTSIAKILNAVEAAEAQFGCGYCGQTIQDAKTCAPCGHSYCDKCKSGFSSGCQECKRSGGKIDCLYDNRQLDQVIGNYNYIRLTLENLTATC